MSHENTKKRTRSGCLTCRRRKVKCKEEKPICSGCQKSNYECLWPENGTQSLSRRDIDAFKVAKANLQKNLTFYVYNGDSNKTVRLHGQEQQKQRPTNFSGNLLHQPFLSFDGQPYMPPKLGPEDEISACPLEEPFFPRYMSQEELDGAKDVAQIGSPKILITTGWWDQYNVQDDSAYLLHTFLHGFLQTVSPQLCHPQLLPATNFVRLGMENNIMRDIFYTCAASFLSQQAPDHQADADHRYAISLSRLSHALTIHLDTAQEWMVGALLLFCLRDKFAGYKPHIPAAHLAKAFEILKKLGSQGSVTISSMKFLAECILFNYAVMLLMADEASLRVLPSPFTVFQEFRYFNDLMPFLNCVPFMNNPVAGAAKDVLEISAKASWLYSKCPLTSTDMAIACNLMALTYSYQPPIIEKHFQATLLEKELSRLNESIAVSEIFNLCNRLLLMKLVIPTLLQFNPDVQTTVATIYQKFLTIEHDSPIWIACSWPLFVGGVCATDPAIQNYVLGQCRQRSEQYQMNFLGNAVNKLQFVWGTPNSPGVSWNCFFDRAFLLDKCF